MGRRSLGFLAVAAVLGSIVSVMILTSRVHAAMTVMGPVSVFHDADRGSWVLALTRKRYYWEGSRAASLGVRLSEALGRGSFSASRTSVELELIFPLDSEECCGWLILPGRAAQSLVPVGSGLFLKSAGDDSFLRWTDLGFVPCPDIRPFRRTASSYLDAEREEASWEQKDLRVDRSGRTELEIGGYSILLERIVGRGLSHRLELRIARGGELLVHRRDSPSHWTRSSAPPR